MSPIDDMERDRFAPDRQDLPEPDLTDPDNPEWTEEDFARAWKGDDIPADILALFPATRRSRSPKAARSAPKAIQDVPIDGDVIEHFRAQGGDWKAHINEALRALVAERAR